MKFVFATMIYLFTAFAFADEVKVLSEEEIKTRVIEITNATNKMMRAGSTVEDVDKWFSNFTDDYVYIHQAYGGTYTKEKLYSGSIANVKNGRYNMSSDRYEIVQILPGYNGAAVQRKNLPNGKIHLSVFEFRGDKVSKITEYWR